MANKPPKSSPAPQQFVVPEEQIGERIRQRRNELALNFEQLARLTAEYDPPYYKKGLTAAMIARYERRVEGRPVMPGARELRLLCDALDVPADWLLYGRQLSKADEATKTLAETAATFVQAAESYKFWSSVGSRDMERTTKLARAKQLPPPSDKST